MKIDPDARLVDVTSKQPGLRWPIPIDARLDGLVGAANAAGAATTRQELLAALVLSAPTAAQKLRDAVLTFRIATVRHAALGNKVGEYPVRRRGRPRGTRRP